MAFTTEFEAIHTKVKRALKETDVDTQAGAHIMSSVRQASFILVRQSINDRNSNIRDQYKIIEQTINDTSGYLVKLKTHLNSLVFINRLPIKLLIRIILFTGPRRRDKLSKYVPYTWVCRHWRSVLIQTAEFWTSIRIVFTGEFIHPFIYEIFKRTIPAKLDLEIYINTRSISALEDLLLEESDRIHTLRVEAPADKIELMVKNKYFPSLRRVVHSPFHNRGLTTGLGLLPLIITSDHLDALECRLKIPMDVLNQLAPVFTHTTKLILHVYSTDILQSVLGILHNNAELRSLKLSTHISIPPTFCHRTMLPELQFLSIRDISLLENFQVPKLTSLNAQSHSLVTIDNPIHRKFDLSSIKYLQVCDWHAILGLTEPIYPKSGFKGSPQENRFIRDVGDDIFHYNDICNGWPLNCFRLTFYPRTLCVRTLQGGFLSRFTGLLELCLSCRYNYKEFCIERILSQIPSLEKLIIPRGGSLMDFLGLFTDPFLCPRLSYVSYTASYSCRLEAEELENLAENVGKLLTECVQSRQKIHGNALKYVTLRKCPPIPRSWLWELQKLGTTVVTAENIQSIITSMSESDDSSIDSVILSILE